MPVLLVTDITRTGEIDDTISLHVYRELERRGCVEVIGVASIFGNGGSITKKSHQNLVARLAQLGIEDWPSFEGPSNRFPFAPGNSLDDGDRSKLEAIAEAIEKHEKVIIVELGPFTVSASLLGYGLVEPTRISKIVGVGGRARGEVFSMKGGLPFAFRDMNIAEDRAAITYLIRNHANKIWLFTYRSGLGDRMIDPEMVAIFGDSEMTAHARKRARRLDLIGYGGNIPCWDTWTSSYFVDGGARGLGCRKMYAKMRYVNSGYRHSDSMQLLLSSEHTPGSAIIDACHK